MTRETSEGRVGQVAGVLGAAFIAACCLGLPAVMSVATALGAGFLLHDEILFPLFILFIAPALWGLRISTRHHEYAPPFWVAAGGGMMAAVGFWLLVAGWWPHSVVLYLGLGGLTAGSIWDLVRSRIVPSCAVQTTAAAPRNSGVNLKKGAAIATAVGITFIAGYEAVKWVSPGAQEAGVRCLGINSCKGTSACSTKSNACNGQNDCKGKGWLFVQSEPECTAKGGTPLSKS
jgi:mercuric ion transport protein